MSNQEKYKKQDMEESSFASENLPEEKHEDLSSEQEKEKLSKALIFSVYESLSNIKNGKRPDEDLASLSPEGKDVLETLALFKNQEDLMPFLQDYKKLKGKAQIDQMSNGEITKFLKKTDKELEKKGYDSKYMELAVLLEILNFQTSKDIIDDILQRNHLENEFNEINDLKPELEAEALEYSRVLDELLGESESKKNLDKVKKDINRIFNEELENLKFINGDADPLRKNKNEEEIAAFKNKMEALQDIGLYNKLTDKQLKERIDYFESIIKASPEETVNVYNMAKIGLFLEERINKIRNILENEYEEINQKIGTYFPEPF